MIRPERTLMIGDTPYYSYDNASVAGNGKLCIEGGGLITYIPLELGNGSVMIDGYAGEQYTRQLLSISPTIELHGSYYRGTGYDFRNNVSINSNMLYYGSISRPIEVYGERVASYNRDLLFTMPADGIATSALSFHFGSQDTEDPPELFVKVGTDVIWSSGWLPDPGPGNTYHFNFKIPIPREWW